MAVFARMFEPKDGSIHEIIELGITFLTVDE